MQLKRLKVHFINSIKKQFKAKITIIIMRIQFDREDTDAMTCFTFEQNPDDIQQMTDLVAWLGTLGISTSKTVISMGGCKMTCLLVNRESLKMNIVPVPAVAPVVHVPVVHVPVVSAKVEKTEDSEESESDEEEDVAPPKIQSKKPVKPLSKK